MPDSFATLSLSTLNLIGVATLIGWLMGRLRLHAARRRLCDSNQARATAQRQIDTYARQSGLASQELRGVGLSLFGVADHLQSVDPVQSSAIRVSATELLDLADTLRADVTAPQTLRAESLGLRLLVDEAIASVAAAVAPGRRHWRVGPGLDDLIVQGDRRALRHVLGRVLADAIRSTRQDDWIDISVRSGGDGVRLVVADEGTGTATAEPGRTLPRDSRGIGLRLAIARALMEAHGGELEVEARSGVGTRVTLAFPAERLAARPADTVFANPVFGGTAASAAVSPRSHSYAEPEPAPHLAGR